MYGAALVEQILSCHYRLHGRCPLQSFVKYVVDAEQAELPKFLKGIDFSELDEAVNAMNEIDPDT